MHRLALLPALAVLSQPATATDVTLPAGYGFSSIACSRFQANLGLMYRF